MGSSASVGTLFTAAWRIEWHAHVGFQVSLRADQGERQRYEG